MYELQPSLQYVAPGVLLRGPEPRETLHDAAGSSAPLLLVQVRCQLLLGARDGCHLGTPGFLNLTLFFRTKKLQSLHKVAFHSLCLGFSLTLVCFRVA